MTPELLSDAVVAALRGLVDDQALSLPDGLPEAVTIERPRQQGHGDYATNIALQLAKKAGLPPREVARLVADRLKAAEGVAAVEVAGPGFLNITVDAGAQGQVAADIVAAGPAYGSSDLLAGHRINLEFVSANPTGPLHLGGTRWAAVGDALGRVFTASGAEVTREYYFNDHGAQIDRFARSLVASARGDLVPEDGYGGDYIHEIAAAVTAQRPDAPGLPEAEAQEVYRDLGVQMMFAEIKSDLHDFGVDFDVFFHEDDLHRSGAVERAVARLTEMGNTYEQDGALWLRTEQYGDDKDRVVIKSDGQPAYISGDLAYYLDKRERGFDRCFIMLGADHHGYVGRMMAMCAAFGDTPHEDLEILIGQLVNLLQDGQPLRMSKRAGTVITMNDLVEAIGVDAARYALARYTTDTNIDIDLALWAKASNDNPVFYVQYAHARVSSILRNAADLGVLGFEPFETGAARPPQEPTGASAPSSASGPATAGEASSTGGTATAGAASSTSGPTGGLALLTDPREGDLLRALADYPRVVVAAAQLREPHRVARYLEDTAAAYHRFYDACRVLPMGEEEPTDLHRARLTLVDATRVVLANGLALLGVSAPERM